MEEDIKESTPKPLIEQSFEHSTKTIILNSGETVSIPFIPVTEMTLFHGSPVSNIEEFQDANEATIGNGAYFTSSADKAALYARVRQAQGPSLCIYRKN